MYIDCFDKGNGGFESFDWVEFNKYELDNRTGVIRRELSSIEGNGDNTTGINNYIIRHPDWNHRTFDNDYALIILDEPVDDIPVLTLMNDTDKPLSDKQELEVIGWGTTGSGESLSNKPLSATVNYVTNERCTDGNPFNYTPGIIKSSMICAADVPSTQDACQGDSGMYVLHF